MMQISVIFLGEFYIGKSDGLTCADDGSKWLYHSIAGEGFIFLVMINMILQCLLIERFLYGVPKKHGCFEEGNDDFKASATCLSHTL
jgi:hypothetical protein